MARGALARKPLPRPVRRDREALAAARRARPAVPKFADAPYHRRGARGR
ncbi:MAG TPA: hypothetical protein VLB86_01460 [Gaiellaceae bacterium]|nr:hypothetical protein [Gaiellaceae bacterium]